MNTKMTHLALRSTINSTINHAERHADSSHASSLRTVRSLRWKRVFTLILAISWCSFLSQGLGAEYFWDAASGVFPDQVHPFTHLVYTTTNTPVLTNGELVFQTHTLVAADNHDPQDLDYMATVHTNLIVPPRLIIEAEVRYESGESSQLGRAPVTIYFLTATNVAGALCIEDGIVFLSHDTTVRGPTANVDTRTTFHLYRIEVDCPTTVAATNGQIRVYQDGLLVLTDTPVSSGHNFDGGTPPEIWWGDGTQWAYGVSHWKSFRHNAARQPSTPVVAIQGPTPQICWNSHSNVSYDVQFTPDLSTSLWANLFTNIPGNGGLDCVSDPAPGPGTQKYYRLKMDFPPEDQWDPRGATNAPPARGLTQAIWTGHEMILWGGYVSPIAIGTGGRFDPVANTWTALPTNNAPSPRYDHITLWTGAEMIVWGGYDASTLFNTGARYNPTTDTWTTISTNGAPSPRDGVHDPVWTGTEMIVWGGYGTSSPLGDGARYNPRTDTWTPITTNGAPSARWGHSSVWTGTNMVVWGGDGISSPLNAGAKYDPSTDTWMPITTNNAPIGRFVHATIWTGKEMIVWGGRTDNGSVSVTGTGGRYDPVLDVWSPVNMSAAPSSRFGYPLQAVWTGNEMIIWGGADLVSPGNCVNNGKRYNPACDCWLDMTQSGAPAQRLNMGFVWTGQSVILSGGSSYSTFYSDTFLYAPPRGN